MKQVIVTGDDFGLAVPVNEAIEEAHRHGVLTAASLMVTAAAAGDAVERATRLPTLRVGLHIVLVEGLPALPVSQVSGLVDGNGEFSTHLVRAGLNFYFRPAVRRQLEAEIRGQFEAFCRTGLQLDHVNAHNHMHLHPLVLRLILKVGREYGLRAVRLPLEPPVLSWRATGENLGQNLVSSTFLFPWLMLMKTRLRHAGIRTNDRVFGMASSGRMSSERVRGFLKVLPEGVTEIYFHPAKQRCPETLRHMPNYRHVDEYHALIDPEIRSGLAAAGAELISFTDLAHAKEARP